MLYFSCVHKKSSKGYEAHHTLPQKHRPEFEKADINIDESGNVVWRESKEHRANNHKHIQEWREFFKEHPNPTREQVLNERNRIEKTIFGKQEGATPAE